jgi:NTE family protein
LKSIGLALGGGGARGIAHIAYIKALSEMGVTPSVISGTSSGAIAGAMYAGGMDAGSMVTAVQQALGSIRQNAFGYFKRAGTKAGGVVSTAAKKTLQCMLPVKSFEDLAIPLRIVATNFHTLKERVFSEGDILGPLMASIAYPSVFLPQPMENGYYMDGGATNIVPFDVIRRECDVLIAIDVSVVRPNEYKPSTKNAVSATWAATQETLISLKLQQCPVELFERPTFEDVATFEFFKFRSIYSRAEEYIPGFKQKLMRILERD